MTRERILCVHLDNRLNWMCIMHMHDLIKKRLYNETIMNRTKSF